MNDHALSITDPKQKRTVSAEFIKAWRKIVSKAQFFVFGGPDKRTKFIIVRGNIDDSLDDFYSLKPTRIAQDPADGSLVGVSGNEVFQLISPKTYPFPMLEILSNNNAQRYGLFSANQRLRTVIYLDRPPQPEVLKHLEEILSDPNSFDDAY